MAAGRENLGDARGLEARHRHAKRGAQACTARAHNEGVVDVIDDRIRLDHGRFTSRRYAGTGGNAVDRERYPIAPDGPSGKRAS